MLLVGIRLPSSSTGLYRTRLRSSVARLLEVPWDLNGNMKALPPVAILVSLRLGRQELIQYHLSNLWRRPRDVVVHLLEHSSPQPSHPLHDPGLRTNPSRRRRASTTPCHRILRSSRTAGVRNSRSRNRHGSSSLGMSCRMPRFWSSSRMTPSKKDRIVRKFGGAPV